MPASAAALLNGTFIQGFELDDFHLFAPLHSTSVVLPALLACAQDSGQASGSRFLLAAIAGFETGPRVRGVRKKFEAITDGVISRPRQAAIIETDSGLEMCENVGLLIDLLAPLAGSPFCTGRPGT